LYVGCAHLDRSRLEPGVEWAVGRRRQISFEGQARKGLLQSLNRLDSAGVRNVGGVDKDCGGAARNENPRQLTWT
jgi:hypothetical protein